MDTAARTFVSSPLQQTYFEFIRNPRNGSAIVHAVAGSGKTTTVIRGLVEFPESLSVLMLAFNTPIAKELSDRIQRLRDETGRAFAKVQGRTFHSIGFGAVAKHLKSKGIAQVETSGHKLRDLLRDNLGDAEREMYGTYAAKLCSLAKGEGIGAIVADTDEAWQTLIAHHDLFLDSEDADEDRALEIARSLLRWSNVAAEKGIIDFDDQLYLTLKWRLRLWQNDVVIVDEAQDTNRVRRAIAKLALRPGGRLIAVGDEMQAIYGFTGASSDAMELIEREFNCARLSLNVSYRCPRAVGDRVRAMVPYFETTETAIEGVVDNVCWADAMKRFTPNDAILCRNTAPMVEFAYGLIAAGIGCRILGREIGEGLINLVKKQKAAGLDRLQEKLVAWREKEVAKFIAKGEEGKAESVTDRVACIETIIANLDSDNRTVPGLLRRIEVMFSDDGKSGLLTLSTIHKAKGREWAHVWVLAPELSPSKFARQDWQVQQEMNLVYVRDTRAMVGLHFLVGG